MKFFHRRRGQVTVELMLILPVFMLLIFFVLEYGNLAYRTILLNHASYEFARIGADTHITPREVIRDFIEVLDIVYQNPRLKVRELLGSDSFRFAQNAVNEEATHQEFAEFEL